MRYKLKTAAAAALLGLVVASCSEEPDEEGRSPDLGNGNYPVTITDDRDAVVTIETMPQTIAAISMPAMDMLAAMGSPIAALTTYQGVRPDYLGDTVSEALDLGELDSPNFEVMAAAGVDLSIGMTRYSAPYASEFEKLGNFIALDGVTLEDSFRNVSQMAAALGAPDVGDAMNDAYRGLIDAYRDKAPGDVSVMLIWAYQDLLFGYQGNLMPAELFDALKAENVLGYSQETESPADAVIMVEAEDILAADPEVLLVFTSHGSVIKNNPAYERLRAVREGRAFAVGQHYSQSTGPIARRVILEELAALLYPDFFELPADLPEAARAMPLVFTE